MIGYQLSVLGKKARFRQRRLILLSLGVTTLSGKEHDDVSI